MNACFEMDEDNPYYGLFGLWDGDFDKQPTIRFGCTKNNVYYNLIYPHWMLNDGGNEIKDVEEYGGWAVNGEYPWNQSRDLGVEVNSGDLYLTVSINPSSNNDEDDLPTQTVYVNGKKIDSSFLGKQYYEKFVTGLDSLNYLDIGRCSQDLPGHWFYQKGLCYCLRLYNKGLSDEEVQANYDTTTEFHKYMLDSKKIY